MLEPRVPVTLLTGFLGAGKTTCLNALLAEESSGRVVVIVNEFGEAGLDHDLIEHSSDDIVLMESGCLCCSIRGDLSKTVLRLLRRRDAGDFDFDRIVIETTGLADPGPILQTFVTDAVLARETRMDGVVTLVDAANGMATLDAQFEAVSQVAMADLILLSKVDLAEPAQLAQFEERLRGLNPGARIVHSVRGAGLGDQLWGLSSVRQDVKPASALAWANTQAVVPDPLDNLSGLADAAPKAGVSFSPHDARIGSASIVLEDPLSDTVFDLWLNSLVALRGPDLLRIKGLVFLEGIDMPFVFHGVQNVFDPPVPVRNWDRDDRRSRIVVIARDLSRPELQRSLDMLRAGPKSRASSTDNLQEVSSE